jgi:hypothetical protein
MRGGPIVLITALWSAAVVLVMSVCGSTLHTSGAAVYTVTALRERLGSQPASVVGRTLSVQGIVQTCGPYDIAPPYCLAPGYQADPAMTVDPFPLVWTAPDPLRRWLAGLPLIDALVHVGQPVSPGEVGTYALRLRVQTGDYCGEPVCYEALLLDAAPPA